MSKSSQTLNQIARPDVVAGMKHAGEEAQGTLPEKLAEFRQGFPVLLAALIGVGFGMVSMVSMLVPLFLVPWHEAFGWELSQITMAPAILTIMMFIVGPQAGRLADRVGARPVILTSIVLLAIGMALVTQVRTSIWWFYAAYLFIGIGGAGTTHVCYSRTLNVWFKNSRGLALGLMMTGPSLLAALTPLFIPDLIDMHGWRFAWLMLAVAALIPLPLVFLFYRERPLAVGTQKVALEGLSTKAVIRTRQFWWMVVATFLMAFSTVGTYMNFLPALLELGISKADGIGMMSVVGLSMLAGRFVSGTLLDLMFAPIVGVAITLISAVGLLLAGNGEISLYTAFAIGFVLGAEADFMAYVAARYFGLRSYSEIFGWIYGVMALGGAASPVWVAWLHRVTGSFHAGFYFSAAFLLVAAVSIALLGRYPKKF
ncbi:MFS transporter [Noviherbaspirillum sedimenti]|uniref:MFS transporter n=1 Tax=Noviherbaspirillum sedimenti TaxID=2320865 RepID=A0A3A3G576_9BURK|nr:MFS transporter [Noviherbaspirillum sedimenti]RJG03091.1 MFS transporter [Noviherbaspirillum sedimenti]